MSTPTFLTVAQRAEIAAEFNGRSWAALRIQSILASHAIADAQIADLLAVLKFARAYIKPTAAPNGPVMERIDAALARDEAPGVKP